MTLAYPKSFLFSFCPQGTAEVGDRKESCLKSPFTAVPPLRCFASSARILRSGKTKGDHPGGDTLLRRWARTQKRNLFTWGWLQLPGSRGAFKSRVKSLLTTQRLISCREHLVDRSLRKNISWFYLRNSAAAKSQITLSSLKKKNKAISLNMFEWCKEQQTRASPRQLFISPSGHSQSPSVYSAKDTWKVRQRLWLALLIWHLRDPHAASSCLARKLNLHHWPSLNESIYSSAHNRYRLMQFLLPAAKVKSVSPHML